jgi:glutamate---cysteine ligase / carboxylate-amine ligase
VKAPIAAFEAYGIELEYAIVDRDTLDVAPLASTLLEAMPVRKEIGSVCVGWSNEIVSHVAELKNVEPVADLAWLPRVFADEVRAANAVLASVDARLLPGGMHPWMDPAREAVLWTHSDAGIYRAYDRIFDCRRHGWANVQSMHINLPFADDAQFERLHAAVRLVLPLVPALAASSPIVDGRITPERDHRLAVYATHMARVPQIVGAIIPEHCASRAAYERDVLTPMYEAIAPHDPDALLRREWLNSHGAIARFDRNAIEIRLADTQESVHADIAVARAICAVVKRLYDERRAGSQAEMPTSALAGLLSRAIRDGENATADESFLRAIGVHGVQACTLRDAWRRVLDRVDQPSGDWAGPIELILERGTLATRILEAAGASPGQQRLREVYAELARCLESGRSFA